jgi:ACS family hexuronate transporter-like MFS transporter
MSVVDPIAKPARSPAWKWWVCVLLLLATMLNYMDRLTLNQMAKQIKDEFSLNNEQYGQIEQGFGMAFAVGAICTGFLVDHWNVCRIYPVGVLLWSAAGFLTGFSRGFWSLLVCRSVLGLTEASHWPCGLRTTQRILAPAERTMGNGLLQSGAALGAIITPLVVLWLVTSEVGSWRNPFFVIGALGTVWVGLWIISVRPADLVLDHLKAPSADQDSSHAPVRPEESALRILLDRRFWVLIVLVVMINLTWHYFRVWLPLLLQEEHHYKKDEVQWFTSAYYLATDAGSLLVGYATLVLARRGMGVHRARVLTYLACSLLTALSLVVAFLPAGPLLLSLLLVIGFGALGLFPSYYSLSQALTTRHQGKLTGTLGFTTWMLTAQMHPLVGKLIDVTGSYQLGVALAGVPPLIGLAALLFLWKEPPQLAGTGVLTSAYFLGEEERGARNKEASSRSG